MSNTTKPRRSRRRFDDEFKAGAARLVLDEGQTVGRVARSQLGGQATTHRHLSVSPSDPNRQGMMLTVNLSVDVAQ